ncbi:MAG: hypothetical protein JRF53_16495 [Deltaproteobacteria bacterium]|nr:hypothetical protein [Deltaproteobacteria bacterium]
MEYQKEMVLVGGAGLTLEGDVVDVERKVEVVAKLTKEEKQQIVDYRMCFSTDAGKRVLGHILADSGYFDTDLSTDGEIAVQNFVKNILKNLGVYNVSTINSYVNNLFKIPVEI